VQRVAFVFCFAPDASLWWGNMECETFGFRVFRYQFRSGRMLEQALTHKAAEIGQAVGYSGGIFV